MPTEHPTPAEYLRKILLSPVYDVARVTPLEYMEKLSERVGCRVSLKREDLQPVHSFKLRGAYNKIAKLPEEAKSAASLPPPQATMPRAAPSPAPGSA